MLAQRPAHHDARSCAIACTFAYIRTVHTLFIGGKRLIGLAMAQEALRLGHRVDVFQRGRTGPDARPGAKHLGGDRNADLSKGAGGIGLALRR